MADPVFRPAELAVVRAGSVARCRITTDLEQPRSLVRAYARQAGLRGERLDDLVLAVNEAVTNVLDHGGAAGTLTARTRPGAVIVEIKDTAGRLTRDHLAAAKVDPHGTHGFGLWVIQHLCDQVHLDQSCSGSRLTLTMNLFPVSA
ncbi:ATP-binding protein [Nonomuraea sp. LPB2021202275-12-8]|uniref:ATP-binding protein n=1 Tax=Nonomuraea sp. LPB2021202275-12-8 TaxID=3120159 RepID=UPI00300D6834